MVGRITQAPNMQILEIEGRHKVKIPLTKRRHIEAVWRSIARLVLTAEGALTLMDSAQQVAIDQENHEGYDDYHRISVDLASALINNRSASGEQLSYLSDVRSERGYLLHGSEDILTSADPKDDWKYRMCTSWEQGYPQGTKLDLDGFKRSTGYRADARIHFSGTLPLSPVKRIPEAYFIQTTPKKRTVTIQPINPIRVKAAYRNYREERFTLER